MSKNGCGFLILFGVSLAFFAILFSYLSAIAPRVMHSVLVIGVIGMVGVWAVILKISLWPKNRALDRTRAEWLENAPKPRDFPFWDDGGREQYLEAMRHYTAIFGDEPKARGT